MFSEYHFAASGLANVFTMFRNGSCVYSATVSAALPAFDVAYRLAASVALLTALETVGLVATFRLLRTFFAASTPFLVA
jgi:hypothetical protein